MNRRKRRQAGRSPANRWVLGVVTPIVFTCGACQSVPLERFTAATRIDVRMNPGWSGFEPPFDAQVKRLQGGSRVTCEKPEAIAWVGGFVTRFEGGWENWWGYPPPPPPVVLEFHQGTQWLGSIDLYDWALGHTHNLIHRVEPEEAAELLRVLCDCASEGEGS